MGPGFWRALFGAHTAHTNAFANALMHAPTQTPTPDWLGALLAPRPADPLIEALVRSISPPPTPPKPPPVET
jgi:hypothetical protein